MIVDFDIPGTTIIHSLCFSLRMLLFSRPRPRAYRRSQLSSPYTLRRRSQVPIMRRNAPQFPRGAGGQSTKAERHAVATWR